MTKYEIKNTEVSDVELIFDLFEHSIKYQQKKGYPVWENYDRNAIINDIENHNQYKVVLSSKTAIVFSVCYHDKIIWRELEKGDATLPASNCCEPGIQRTKIIWINCRMVSQPLQGEEPKKYSNGYVGK